MNNLIKRVLKYFSILFVITVAVFVFIIHVHGNFYQVNDGVYRSGQLNKYNLEYYINKHEIKTILNLRGKSKKDFYADETSIANQYDVEHIDYKISNRVYLDFNRTSEIVNIMKNAQKPLLIHCAGGADRTSLASALYQYAIAGKSVEESKEEFSFIYGHLPSIRPYVQAMGDSFDNYVEKITNNKQKEDNK